MKKQINNIQELIVRFPSFEYQDNKVCPCCDNCIKESCLFDDLTPYGICSNYKFSEKKFMKE